jgi:hypothetical protein
MRAFYFDLICRICHNFLAGQGTTFLGFISNWTPSILSAIFTVSFIFWKQGWKAVIEHLRRSVLLVFAAAIAGNVIWFSAILVWTAIKTIYQEHEKAQAKIIYLKDQVSELQTKSPYEKSFVGSFAFTNTVGAFSNLSRDTQIQPNEHSECQIKITSPPENKQAALGLRSIAGTMGCHVVQEPSDPDVNSESWSEINRTLPNFVVIHAAKENYRADSFVVGMGNTFHVRRAYDLPSGSPKSLVWLQIGSGSIWRIN